MCVNCDATSSISFCQQHFAKFKKPNHIISFTRDRWFWINNTRVAFRYVALSDYVLSLQIFFPFPLFAHEKIAYFRALIPDTEQKPPCLRSTVLLPTNVAVKQNLAIAKMILYILSVLNWLRMFTQPCWDVAEVSLRNIKCLQPYGSEGYFTENS